VAVWRSFKHFGLNQRSYCMLGLLSMDGCAGEETISVCNHASKLSLAIHLWVGTMSIFAS